MQHAVSSALPTRARRTRHLIVLLLVAILATATGIIAGPSSPTSAATTTLTAKTLVPTNAPWRYLTRATPPPSNWKTLVTGWTVANAPFGRGANTGTITTRLPAVEPTAPLSTYFRKSFTISGAIPEKTTVTTWADDGIVVYVNGREVGRSNVAAGTVTHKTYATKAPQSADARKTPVTFTIPASALVKGNNVIAAQVISNWRDTHNITFAAKVTRYDKPVTATPAPAPKPTASASATPKPTPKPTASATPKPTAAPKPPTSIAPPAAGAAGWGAPTWSDEFTYVDPTTKKPAVDPTKWNVRDRSDLGLLFDAAVPSDDQVTVDSAGILHIRADWLDKPVVRPAGQSGPSQLWHETGYLDQRKLGAGDVSKTQTYGRWEIRAKTPTGPNTLGSLAAFWLRNGQSGEIDIMEAWGYDDKAVRDQRIDTATTTVHTHTSDPAANKRYIWHHADFGGPDKVWQGFHVYAFEYTPEYAAVFVDGKEMLRATPKTHPNLWDTRYYGSPFHMRLNLHVGPSAQYWGLPDPNNKAATQNLDFQVDYVRTWAYTP